MHFQIGRAKIEPIFYWNSYGHLFFKTYSQKIKVCFFLILKPIVERFLASYVLIFVKKYHMGLNNPRTPSEMEESKLDKNGWVSVGSWDPYVIFLNQRAGYKKLFGNRFGICRSKFVFCESDLKNKWLNYLLFLHRRWFNSFFLRIQVQLIQKSSRICFIQTITYCHCCVKLLSLWITYSFVDYMAFQAFHLL